MLNFIFYPLFLIFSVGILAVYPFAGFILIGLIVIVIALSSNLRNKELKRLINECCFIPKRQAEESAATPNQIEIIKKSGFEKSIIGLGWYQAQGLIAGIELVKNEFNKNELSMF